MKLYSYPHSKMAPRAKQNNMVMPPDFKEQVMKRKSVKPLPPNSIKKYPGNVPYPYGMRRFTKNVDMEDRAIRDLEKLSKPQYRGDSHYRSKEYLNE